MHQGLGHQPERMQKPTWHWAPGCTVVTVILAIILIWSFW